MNKYVEGVRKGAMWIWGKSIGAEGMAETKVLKWVWQAGQCGERGDWRLNLGVLHRPPTLLKLQHPPTTNPPKSRDENVCIACRTLGKTR